MTNLGHEINPSDARRRQIRLMQVLYAGAATVTALALFGASQPADAGTVVASGPSASAPFATDDTNFVNDQGQTSGDIFQQNAQDQN
jgi:hypothetical protein